MIDYSVLRNLFLEALKENPKSDIGTIQKAVEQLVVIRNLFPTEEECRKKGTDYKFYRDKRLNPQDELNLNQIAWDLIVDRILTVGSNTNNSQWPNFRLTEFGKTIVKEPTLTPYNPDEYVDYLVSVAPDIDPVIKQYTMEGLKSYRQRLFFSSAVMFGAAAEKAVLILLQAIGDAEVDGQKKREITNLLERGRLPSIFGKIQSRLEELKNVIPYSVHQSSSTHLISLFEMIRVQRNDAVHPLAGQVNREKIFLTIQSFPAALEILYRLVGWFRTNQV